MADERDRVGPRPGDLRIAALLAFLSLLILLPGARTAFWDRDEAEYAAAARAMERTGEALVPHLFGAPFLDKPPLCLWLSAVSFRVLGESELAGRLPHVLLAAGCPLLLFFLGRLSGARAGSWAALALSTSLLFIACGRLLLTDSALLFFDLGTIIFLDREGRGSRIAAGLLLGLALLAKGPIAVLAPGLFVLGRMAGGAAPREEVSALGSTAAVAAVVAAPWFLLAARATGGRSLRVFFLTENISRFLHPREHHSAPAFAAIAALALALFPWSGLLSELFHRASWRRDPNRWGMLSWGLGSLAFFAASATKLPHYLLPALPAFLLLVTAGTVSRRVSERRTALWAVAIFGTVLFLGAVWGAGRSAIPELLAGALVPFGVIALLSLALPLAPARLPARAVISIHAVLASGALAMMLPPALESSRCYRDLGREASRRVVPGEPLGGLRFREPALEYYAGDRRREKWEAPRDAARAALAGRTGSALVWARDVDGVAFARGLKCRVEVLARGFNLIEPGVPGAIDLLRIRPKTTSAGAR